MMRVDLLCLGVGKGASYVMRGRASTAFVLRVDGKPELLVDCGAGIALSYQRHVGKNFPPTFYISHNHGDHAGDLPVVLECIVAGELSIIGNPAVLDILRRHRLHDAPRAQERNVSRVNWIEAEEGRPCALACGLWIELLKTRHSYLCYGFLLGDDRRPLLGYTADSPYDETLLEKVASAPFALVDACDEGGAEHASLEAVDGFAGRHQGCAFRIVHYEESGYILRSPNAQFLSAGDVIELNEH